MKLKSFSHMNCSLAQAVEEIGERWTLLILRNAFLGSTRFEQFQKSLGIARNILSTRLDRLVGNGIFEKRAVEGSARLEYVLTKKGMDLQPVLLSITHWGDCYKPNRKGRRVVFVERATGRPIRRMAVHSADGRVLKPREIRAVPGPGLGAQHSAILHRNEEGTLK